MPPPFALFFFMPIFFVVFFASFYWPPVRDILAARRLFKKGRLTTGTVVFVKKRSPMNWANMPGNGTMQVFIQFHTRDGQTSEAVASCRNEWLTSLLTPGTHVHIAYAEGNLKAVALLEAFVR